MGKEYLFIFGYEHPAEHDANADQGADYESSGVVRIIAADKLEALNWGREIAENFVAQLYRDPTVSWKSLGFAAWVEEHPDDYLRQRWSEIPLVRVGEFPPNLRPLSHE